MDNSIPNKFKDQSRRLPNWDYGQDAYYFVTIKTECNEACFGKIENSQLILSGSGLIAKRYWLEIPNHFSFVEVDEFIIMPDHIHGIIKINKNENIVGKPESGSHDYSEFTKPIINSPKLGKSAENKPIKPGGKKPQWKPGTLGVVINQYKRKCTIEIRKTDPDFGWQPNYYDHIIRNKKSLFAIRNYIKNNPVKWDENDFDWP